MYRIDNSTNSASIPTPEAVGANPNGYFTKGNPNSAIPATILTADWANAVQEEIANVIEGAGITLSKVDRTQLAQAIIKQNNLYAVATGVDTYVATVPGVSAYTAGQFYTIKFTNANTTAATLNINALGTKSIKLPDGNPLLGVDIAAGMIGIINYDGTNLILHNPNTFLSKIGRKGTDVASASTINLSTSSGDWIDVTGSTTINAISTETLGVKRTVRFTGSLTLTHNATNLILPSATNIVTTTNDFAVFRSLGSGNWICENYQRASGSANAPFVDTNAIVQGSVDSSRRMRFEVDGLTTATTRVITVADRDMSLDVLGYEYISKAVASNTPTISFTNLSTTYYTYLILIRSMLAQTGGTDLLCLFSTNNGSSYITSNYEWVWTGSHTGSTAANQGKATPAADIRINASGSLGLSAAGGEEGSFNVYLYGHASGNRSMLVHQGSYVSNTSRLTSVSGSAQYFGATLVNAIQFKMSSGNIVSGTFALYGIRSY